MRSLTEQVTFKVSRDMLAILQERGRLQGLDANPYARKLVEEGLESDRAEHLADELRELLGLLRPLASQLTTVADSIPASSVAPSAGDQIEQITDVVSQAANHFAQTLSNLQSELEARLEPINVLANQLFDLRADFNKSFAALLHYQMGFTVEEAQRWVDARLNAKQR